MIDSPRAAAVRRVAALKQKAHRADTGLALLEGPQVVREVLAHRPDTVESLYVTDEAAARHPDLLALAEAADLEPEAVAEAALAAMADTRTPQGVVAVARQSLTALRDAVRPGDRLVVVLDEVRDPGNAGTILRAADAAGADAVILAGDSVDPYNPKVVRATTGSLFHLRVTAGVPLEDALAQVRSAGLAVLAADMAGQPLPSLDLTAPTAWLFGNEARGLSAGARRLADRTAAVPIYGAAESLNLATAAAVCLYASAFAQRG